MDIKWTTISEKKSWISVFYSVISRTNGLFSHHVAASPNILRNIGAGREFSALCRVPEQPLYRCDTFKYFNAPQITQSAVAIGPIEYVPNRTVTKYGSNGKRATVKAVIRRFYRLHWGGWIRTRCGRHKKMWKKTSNRKHRLRQHVLVNGQQSHLLDLMVTKFWKRPKHYIDDIYEPYHTRSFYWARREPMSYPSKPVKQAKSLFRLSKEFD